MSKDQALNNYIDFVIDSLEKNETPGYLNYRYGNELYFWFSAGFRYPLVTHEFFLDVAGMFTPPDFWETWDPLIKQRINKKLNIN